MTSEDKDTFVAFGDAVAAAMDRIHLNMQAREKLAKQKQAKVKESDA